jgi:CubicO group peptidase (beta-lactamase class C family)
VASSIDGVVGKLEQAVASFVKEHRLPGAAAGVVHGDELVWSFGHGYADVAGRRPHDARTMFRIASITKTFTGTAILQLRDEGALHLDDPAVAFLPELRDARTPFGAIETVTIRRLLSHESGLMGDPPGARWFHDVYEPSPEVNLAKAAEIATAIPPNAHQKYSNLGFQFLGEIVARVAARPFTEVIQGRILGPLGMKSTGFAPLPADLGARLATGYRPRWLSDTFEPATGLSTFPQAEGGLYSCVEDLARWVSAQFPVAGGPEGHRTVLADETLREMQRPRYLEGDEWDQAWCVAWYARRKDGVAWIQHSGGLPGFTTNACFVPKDRVGAIALVNGAEAADELSMKLGAIALAAVREAVVPVEVPPSVPEGFDRLLGLYGEPAEAILLRLEWRDADLVFVDPSEPSWDLVLIAGETPDRFVAGPGRRESGEPVEFHRRADGAVTGVTIGPYTLDRFEPVPS